MIFTIEKNENQKSKTVLVSEAILTKIESETLIFFKIVPWEFKALGAEKFSLVEVLLKYLF